VNVNPKILAAWDVGVFIILTFDPYRLTCCHWFHDGNLFRVRYFC
jgi:hypothetical protein